MNRTITLPIEVVERALASLESAFGKHSKSASDIRAALEQPDAGIPVSEQDNWKMVPVEPTEKMVDMGRGLSSFPGGVYRAMLAAAPQPPTVKESLTVEQPQVEQEPVAKVVLTEQLGLPCLQWLDLDRQFDFKGGELLYTHPQPKREPLTDECIYEISEDLKWYDGDCDRYDIYGIARAIEAAHDIGGEA